MRYDINIINPIEYRGWDDLLVSSRQYSFFHTTAWAKVLWETYHYRPVYFTLIDDNRLLALIPVMEVKSIFTGLRGVSLPFTDYCQAIITEDVELEGMLDFVKEYGRRCKWKFIEIRGGHYPDATATASFYRHRLKLTPDLEQIFSRFKDSTKRNIRKAMRMGVEVQICRTPEAVDEYCRLHYITRKKHGLPPQPRCFFEKIYEHIISKELGFIALACYHKKNIAGALFLNFKEKSLFKFGASDHTYQHLRANDLVMWEAIKWCAQNKYQNLCFGRTALNNTGLRRFKAGWGVDEQIINYYRYDLRQDAFVIETSALKNFHHRIFRIMPIPLLKMLGSLLYRHIG
jgi:hypothetical protein